MTISGRLTMLFKAEASRVLDRAQDPRETLDCSYQKQLELLQQVRRGVADVATNRKRLELQAEKLASSADKLLRQASQAVSAGNDDLAREPLTRWSATEEQLADLGRHHASLRAQEAKLTLSAQRLHLKVEAFRTRTETIKATYTAAEAQAKMGEAFSGISEEMADVGLAMQRAEDKTTRLQARTVAISAGQQDPDTSRPPQREPTSDRFQIAENQR
ncbi:MAG: PspA/IM30 family protein [Actinomycetota bacterium]